MKLQNKTLFISIIIIIFGGIIISDNLGFWITGSTKVPRKTEVGVYDPGDIRGSYSFDDISNSFNITPEVLAEAFGIITENPNIVQAKDIENLYGDLEEGIEIGTGSIKYFVALYCGIPYESEDILPLRAIEILYEEGKITDEKREQLMASVTDLSQRVFNEPIEDDMEEEIFQVKGKTTVQEVINAGVSIEELQAILGIEIESRGALIKDLCTENSLSFSEIKTEINQRLEVRD